MGGTAPHAADREEHGGRRGGVVVVGGAHGERADDGSREEEVEVSSARVCGGGDKGGHALDYCLWPGNVTRSGSWIRLGPSFH